jgi:hypothetical protein
VSKNPKLTNHTNIKNVRNHQQKVKTNNDISKCQLSNIQHQNTQTSNSNFLELEEPFIYSCVPRYIIELVAKQGSLCENITITFTLRKNTSMHVL